MSTTVASASSVGGRRQGPDEKGTKLGADNLVEQSFEIVKGALIKANTRRAAEQFAEQVFADAIDRGVGLAQ
jgi:hypothetical protein